MSGTLQDKVEKLRRQQKNRRRILAMLTALSVCVAAATFAAQSHPATALDSDNSTAVSASSAAAEPAASAAAGTQAPSAGTAAADSVAAPSESASSSSAASSSAASAPAASAAPASAAPAAAAAPAATVLSAANSTAIDLSPYITGATVKNKSGTVVTTVKDGDFIQAEIDFSLPENLITKDNKTLTYQLPDGLTVTAAQSGSIFASDETTVIATYTISTNGLITITATDAYADGSALSGNVKFSGSASNSSTTEDKTVTFGATGSTLTIEHGTTPSGTDLSVQKWDNLSDTSGKYDGKIHYTVAVSTTNGSQDVINLSDTLTGDNISYDENSFVITAPDGTVLPNSSYLGFGSTSFRLYNLPKLAAGEHYTISYTATPNSSFWANSKTEQTVSNSVTATSGSDSKTDATTTWLGLISKSGSYDASKKTITWTISLNRAHQNLNGTTLSDLMTNPDGTTAAYTGTASVWPAIGGSSTISLPYTFTSDDYNAYTITYTTTPDNTSIGTKTYSNAATVDTGGTTHTADSGGITVGSSGHVTKAWSAEKALAGSTGIEYVWTTTMNMPSGGITTDYFAQDFLDSQNHRLTITADTADDFALTGVDAAGNATLLTEGTDYTVTLYKDDSYAVSYSSLADLKAQGGTARIFAVHFLKAIPESTYARLLLTYGTYADTSGVSVGRSRTFYNSVQFGTDDNYETAAAQHRYTKTAALAKQGRKANGKYTDADFSVDYDAVSGKLGYRLLANTDASMSGDFTITDTLPAGTTFDDSSFQAAFYYNDYYMSTDTWINNKEYKIADLVSHTVTKNADGSQTLTITVKSGYESVALAFTYAVSIDGAKAGTTAYTNTATCGGTSSSQTQKVTRTIKNVVKSAEQGNGTDASANVVTYRIVLNPLGADLDPNKDRLTLTDVLSVPAGAAKDVHLLQTSVKLFLYDGTAANGEGRQLGTDAVTFTYDAASNTTTFTVPDGKALVLEYRYHVELADGTTTADFANTATLTGGDGSSGSKTIAVKTADSSATLQKQRLTFYKVDAANFQTTLAGAAFELDRWGGYNNQNWTKVGDYTTGADGTFSFDGSASGAVVKPDESLYRLVETAAPDGYAKAAAPYYFLWAPEKDSSGTAYTLATLKTATYWTLSGSGATQDTTHYFLFAGGSAYLQNARNSIAVKKVWHNPDGTPGSAGATSVAVTLYRDGAAVEQQTLSAANDWTYTWKGLDTASKYTVAESGVPSGYAVSYDNNDGITAGTILVVNTGTPSYTLPETGGTGTRPFALAGAGALAAAALFALRPKKRRCRAQHLRRR